jgi:hypothetical protein
MLFPMGMSNYAIALRFITVSKKVKEFLGEIDPIIASTSLSIVRAHHTMQHNPISFIELEDRLENKHGQQVKVRVIFWRENADAEPAAILLLAEDIDMRAQIYETLNKLMETSNC